MDSARSSSARISITPGFRFREAMHELWYFPYASPRAFLEQEREREGRNFFSASPLESSRGVILDGTAVEEINEKRRSERAVHLGDALQED